MNYYADPLFWDKKFGPSNAFRLANYWSVVNEHLPQEIISKIRQKRLRRLLRHAYQNVPLYRDLYIQNGVSPSAVNSEEDLAYLPVVKKDDFRTYFQKQGDYAKNLGPSRRIAEVTSGSTGEPFRFFQDAEYRTERLALGARIWRWAKADVYAAKLLIAPESARKYYPNSVFLHPHFVKAKKREYLNQIQKLGIKFIFGSPLMTLDFLWEIDKLAGGTLRFEKAILGGHAVAPGVRGFLKERFGCEVFEFYASGETRMIGIECELHNGLHIQEDNLIVEIIDEENKIVPPGRVGRIVVTALSNEVMPFIRYELGDLGAILPNKCLCGKTSRLVLIEGRTNEALLLSPNGSGISPAVLRDILDKYFMYFQRYQLTQLSMECFELYLVPTKLYRREIGEEIASKIKKSIGNPVTLNVRCVDKLPSHTASGKFPQVSSRLWEDKFPASILRVSTLRSRISAIRN